MLAAKDIVDAIKMSWIRQWWEFCGGALVLIGTKMRETAEILNVPLHELGGRNIPFHIVAIKRGNETIIPVETMLSNCMILFISPQQRNTFLISVKSQERNLSRCTQCNDYGRQPNRCTHHTIRTRLYAGQDY